MYNTAACGSLDSFADSLGVLVKYAHCNLHRIQLYVTDSLDSFADSLGECFGKICTL